MIQLIGKPCILATCFKPDVATHSSEKVLLSIEERHWKREIASILRGFRGNLKEILNRDRGTGANAIMSQIKAMKGGTTKGPLSGSLLDVIVD